MAIYQANADFFEDGTWVRKGTVVEDDSDLYARFPAKFTAVTSAESISGATAQEQIDSVVSALVALGLATDDR